MATALDFDTIHAELRPKIARYLRRLVGAAEAEDVTQEVFTRVSQALADFRGDSTVATWVYRIATHAAFDRLRRVASRRAGDTLLRIGQPPAERLLGVEEALERREMSACIRGHVAALPPAYRSALLLHDEGLDNRQIAGALGISLGAAKIRLHRARARLRKALGDACRLSRDGDDELVCEPMSPAGRIPGPPASVNTSGKEV